MGVTAFFSFYLTLLSAYQLPFLIVHREHEDNFGEKWFISVKELNNMGNYCVFVFFYRFNAWMVEHRKWVIFWCFYIFILLTCANRGDRTPPMLLEKGISTGLSARAHSPLSKGPKS